MTGWSGFGPAVVTVALLAVYVAHLMGLGPVWGAGDEETMKNLTIMVASYWVGSSHGSDRKTEILHADHADPGGPKEDQH